MSEDQAQEPGPEQEPAKNGGDSGIPGSAVSGGSRETVRLWIKMAGYFVMCMGGLTVYAAIMLRAEVPGLITIGFLLAGASYVLAGQALSEGYSWPLPIALMSGIFSPFILISLLSLFGGMGFYRLLKDRVQPGDLREGVSQNTMLTYGLWMGGVVLVIFEFIRQIAQW